MGGPVDGLSAPTFVSAIAWGSHSSLLGASLPAVAPLTDDVDYWAIGDSLRLTSVGKT